MVTLDLLPSLRISPEKDHKFQDTLKPKIIIESTFPNAFEHLTKTFINLVYFKNIIKNILVFIIVRIDRNEIISKKVHIYLPRHAMFFVDMLVG